jgi:hypothetical protein
MCRYLCRLGALDSVPARDHTNRFVICQLNAAVSTAEVFNVGFSAIVIVREELVRI